MKNDTIRLNGYFIILAVFWTALILLLLTYDHHVTLKNIQNLARIQAVTGLEKDIIYRKWNAQNGGVYGSISAKTQPNDYLKVQERDIATPSGKRNLTLINPAYMTRQVHELELEKRGVVGHITSLNPIRPQNRADKWETAALTQFENGTKEVSSLEYMHNRSYLRVMRPLLVMEACMGCHAAQGYEVGQVRGGLSISVPMEPWLIYRNKELKQHRIFLVALWLLVMVGLTVGFMNMNRKMQQNQKIQANLNNMKSVLDRIDDIVLLIHPDTLQLIYVNQAAIAYSGYSEKELLRMYPYELFPDAEHRAYEKRITALRGSKDKKFQFESTVVHKEGGLSPVDVQQQYLQIDHGVEYIVAVLRDSSIRKENEVNQKQMRDKLQASQKLESVGQLAAGIAHELNTPAQYIGSNLDFLSESFVEIKELIDQYHMIINTENNSDPVLIENIGHARRSADYDFLAEEIPQAIAQSQEGIKQVSQIVLAMKDFSHPGSKELEPAHINRIIKTAVTVSRNEWKDYAEMRLNLTEKNDLVTCRPNEISRVLVNLIINAAHAIDDYQKVQNNRSLGTITLTTQSSPKIFEISIKDTGSGIPEPIRHKIFDPFFTTKEVGKGTGQGLNIAYDIITNKHQGTLKFETVEGAGTTFTIRLPKSIEE